MDYNRLECNTMATVYITYHRGRWTEIKEYLYWSHIENNCSFSLFLKFGVFKWKCDFLLSFLTQVLVLYSKIQKS